MEGRGLLFGGRRGQDGLGVFGEVIASVWGVEAFGEHDYLGPIARSFEHLVSGMKEVLGFVRTCSSLSALH